MKILKEGKLPVETPLIYQGTCSNCGCVIEVKYEETYTQDGNHVFIAENRLVMCPTEGCRCPILVKKHVTLTYEEVMDKAARGSY